MSVQTLEEAIDKIVSQLTGSILPPGLDAMAVHYGTKWLKQGLGINNDVMLDAVITSDLTPYGTSRYLQERLMRRVAKRAMEGGEDAAKRQALTGWMKTQTPYSTWKNLSPEQQLGSYDNYIAQKVSSNMDNFMYSAMYNMLDPMGANKASSFLATAATNMMRHGVSRGDRNAYLYATKLAEGLFTDPTKRTDRFDARDFGYMQRNDVAAIASMLTKDLDFTRDIKPGSDLKDKVEAFRNTVQDYSKALSPLKDVFGSDIPTMVKALEQVSGQSIAQMGAARVKHLSDTLSEGLMTGRYSMEEITGVTAQFKGALKGMGISGITRMNAGQYAQRMLNAAYGGVMPSYMDREEFIEKTADLTLRTAASTGADQANMAYALWAERQGSKEDKSFEAFRAAYDKLGGGGLNTLLQLAGVSNQYALKQGLSYAGYERAKREGFGSMFAMTETVAQSWEDVRTRLLYDTNLEGVSQQDIEGAIDLLQKSPELANLTGEELAANTQINEGQLRVILRIKNDADQNKAVTRQLSLNNQKEQENRVLRIRQGKEIVEKQGVATDESLSQVVADIVGITSGKGAGDSLTGRIKEKLKDSLKLSGPIDEDALLETAAAADAAYNIASTFVGDNEADKNKFAAEMMRYVNSAASLSNKGFRDALAEYRDSKTPEQKRQAAAKMAVYKNISADTINKYIENTKDTDLRDLLKIAQNPKHKSSDDRINAMQSHMQTVNVNTAVSADIEALKADKNVTQKDKNKQDTLSASLKGKTETPEKLAETIKRLELDEATQNRLIKTINRESQGAITTGDTQKDVFNLLTEVLKEFRDFLKTQNSGGTLGTVKFGGLNFTFAGQKKQDATDG